MKITDNIVNKYGYDKIIHYLVGTAATGVALNYGYIVTAIVIVALLIASYIKEKKLDDFFDKKDIIACIYGILTSIGLYIPKILLSLL